MSRLREMLLLPKGSDLKNSDSFSDLESNKWKGKFIFIITHVMYLM